MPKALLTLLLDLDDQLRRDQAQTAAFLHRRDRKFALACKADGRNPEPRTWLRHLNTMTRHELADRTDPRLRLWHRITVGFGAIGAVLGIVTMLGLLFYDGGQQINITVILAFVVLQLGLALLTSLQSALGWRPWGRLPSVLARRLGLPEPSESILGQLQPQLTARAAHTGGLMFGITGWLTLLSLIVVQDLAFGWSTTLNTAPSVFHSLVHAIAVPWQDLWPAAAPSVDLVAQSRFYRIESAGGVVAPARWGEWWPFVVMVWLSYVILPRLVLLLAAVAHLSFRAKSLLTRHPGLHALHYRMETPVLETGNAHSDASDQPEFDRSGGSCQPLPDASVLIRWAQAADPDHSAALLSGDNPVMLSAGGSATLADDNQTLEQARIALGTGRSDAVLILTRAWEPPTGELADFLAEARSRWPNGTHIALVPMAAQPAHQPPMHQLGQWLRFVERLQDDLLLVARPTSPDTEISSLPSNAAGEPS